MDAVAYFLVYVSCTLLKKVKFVEGEKTIFEFITSVAGGAAEELLECFIQKLFPNGSWLVTKKMKKKRRFFEELLEQLNNYKTSEELLEFFNSKSIGLPTKLSNKFNNLWETVEGDTAQFFEGIEHLTKEEAEKKIQAYIDAIKKIVAEAYKIVDKKQTESLNVRMEDVVKDIFKVEWKDVPVPAQELFKTIKCLFVCLYRH